MVAENPIMKRAQVGMVETGAILWRNNVGTFLQGRIRSVKTPTLIKVNPDDVIITRPRHIKCGLDVGSSDLIGLTPIVVTQAMVGKTVAVFTSPEAKDEDGVTSPEQHAWIEMIKENGGIAFVFHDEKEARRLLADSIRKITE